jgi:N-acetylneuraminic acid mutarotase
MRATGRHSENPMKRAVIESLEDRRLLSVSTPFHGTPFVVNQTIQAEDFDKGGEGVSYHDTTAADLGSMGSSYRSTAVDIQAGGSNGYDVGYTVAGEWMKYSVNVAQAGTYQLQSSIANTGVGASFHVEFNGTNVTGSIAVPNSGGWQSYKSVSSNTFTLNSGAQVMRVVFDKATAAGAVGNFDTFKIIPVATGTLSWKTAASAPIGLAEAQSATTNGKLYVFGGYYTPWLATTHAYSYNPATNAWSRLADMPQPLTHMGVAADGRYIYIAGGYVTNPTTKQQTFASANVWRYDTQTNTYSAFVSLPNRRGAGALAIVDHQLHFFGGVDPNRVGQIEHWMLDLTAANPHWVTETPMPFTRNHLATAVLNGRIYAIGGQEGTNDSAPSPDVLVYFDPKHPDQWTPVADLPAARSHMAAISTGNHIIVMAGEGTGGKILSSTVEYDPQTNTWSPMTAMPDVRLAPVAGYINGRIVFATGYSAKGLQTTTWVSNPII